MQLYQREVDQNLFYNEKAVISENAKQLNEIIDQMYSSFGKVATELTYEMFQKVLRNYTNEQIKEAFFTYAESSSHCPKPAEILTILKESSNKYASSLSSAHHAKIAEMPSRYEKSFMAALKIGNVSEAKRLGAIMSNEFVFRLGAQ